MKNWIPGYKRPRVFRQFESRKKYTGSKDNEAIENSFQNPGNPFIKLAKED